MDGFLLGSTSGILCDYKIGLLCRFFIMHLINKPETEYTGQETYVYKLYSQRCWDFFPVGDCFIKQHETEPSG